MNKKNLRIILIIVVALIWVAAIYRIFSFSNNDGIDREIQIPTEKESTEGYMFQDTFKLYADYRNPFHTTYYASNTTSPQRSKLKKVVQPKIDKPIKWPSVIYNGRVKSQDTKKEVALVQINNQEYMMQIGEIISDVTLLKLTNDFIEVSYENQTQTIRK